MWKLENQPRLPEDDVAAFFWIEISKCSDGTESKRTIHHVSVLITPDILAKIERSARVD